MAQRATLWLLMLTAAGVPTGAAAQVCAPRDAERALVPGDPPDGFGYETTPPAPYWETDLGIGHLYHAPEQLVDGPPGEMSWMQRVELPFSEGPGLEPFAWLARGWIVTSDGGQEALSLAAMLETGYEEASFIVYERREGWLRVRYGANEQDPRSAWIPDCALTAGSVRLAFAPWDEWLLSDEISPLFVRDGRPLSVHAEPSEASRALASVSNQDALEPLEIRGAWMRVTHVQPTDYCDPDAVGTRREGWVQWLGAAGSGPRLWYHTRGC